MFNVVGAQLIIDQHALKEVSYLEAQAAVFAAKAHAAQVRKYSGAPYIVHPQEVVSILKGFGYNDDHLFATAWLHDVVEDTPITLPIIGQVFGSQVEFYVTYVTDQSRPEDGNRRKRKEIDRTHASRGPAASQNVKCADIISNAPSIRINDPDFFQVWSNEKVQLLSCLELADRAIKDEAFNQLR
ncbi:MAG: HD domain-containing protein [Betaproteobacteria bacterium]